MCGIAGAIDLRGRRTFPVERLRRMTAAIAHRGPDDEHTFAEPGVALGARRLSIIDLAGGRQPLSNEAGSVWVAFNGELFEHPELFADLKGRGHRFSTRCDTELWVHLYEEYGERFIDHARGQFAFSLWDRQRRTGYLGRDRVGIVPLYYAERDGWLLWGSEIKALLASGLIDPLPDVRGIDHVFTFFAAGASQTCFQGIESLPPGHWLKVHDGRIELRRYWDLDFPDAGTEQRWDDLRVPAGELERLLRAAVKRRLRSDVPVVTYLSGGLDSSVILGLCGHERNAPIRSYTIGLEQAGPDERSRAAETAALLGSPLTTVTMNAADITNAYPELITAAESPVIDTSCACLLRLAARVHRDGFRVALTGEGADEALAGYVWFRTQKIGQTFGPGLHGLLMRGLLALIGGSTRHRPPWNAIGGVRTPQQDVAEMVAQPRGTLYTPQMWERLHGSTAFDRLDVATERIKRWHPLNQALYTGYKIMLPGLLLMAKGDRVAMNSSVETRYPFLDEDLIAFCARIDPRYKLRMLREKWLLRKMAARALPPVIAKRPKTMFRATRSQAFLGPRRPAWVDQLLSPESLRATGYFDVTGTAAARRMLAERPALGLRRAFFDFALTAVISTQLWHHVFCKGGLADLPTWSPPEVAPTRAADRTGMARALSTSSLSDERP